MGAPEMIEEAQAIIGGARDPLGPWWDQAGELSRYVLLTLAGAAGTNYAAFDWMGLPARTRAEIAIKARSMRDWLNSLPLGGE